MKLIKRIFLIVVIVLSVYSCAADIKDAQSDEAKVKESEGITDVNRFKYLTQTYKDNSKYLGELNNGKRHGFGTLKLANGVEYTGEWENSETQGRGIMNLKSGFQLGNWKNGERHGNGALFGSDGSILQKGRWDNGKFAEEQNDSNKNRFESLSFTDGSKYMGEVTDNKPHGLGVMLYTSGNIYLGDWKNNKKDGKGVLFYKEGAKFVGEFKNGNRHGQGIVLLATGAGHTGEWRNEERHGSGKMFGADESTIEIGNWENDKFVGNKKVTESVEAETPDQLKGERKIKETEKEDTLSLAEPLPNNPKLQAIAEEWKKEFYWREKLLKEEAIKIISINTGELEDYIKNDSEGKYGSYVALQILAGKKMEEGKMQEAADLWKKYENKFPNKNNDIAELITMLGEKVDSEIQNLGDNLNSKESEYLPVPEISGRKLYFTSKDRLGGEGGEDIWESTFDEKIKRWNNIKPVSELNDSGHQAPMAISPDGTEMYLFGNYKDSLGSGDIYKSKLGQSGWKQLENLGRPINSKYFDSDITFSSNGKFALFASDRPSGYFSAKRKGEYFAGEISGNTDIYVVFKNANGTYSLPRNVGPIINTPGTERTPYLHPDGKTLYFSSSGHNGFGGVDIFKSIRLDDTWQNWSKPINLGRVLNDAGTNWGFRLTAASDRGFFSAELKNALGKEDLYEVVPLPRRAKPSEEVVGIYGKILDELGKPIEAKVTWQNLKTGETMGQLMSKATTGEFYITLPVGGKYAYFSNVNGYLNQSQTIDLTKDKKFREENFEMKIISIDAAIKHGTEITLNNIFFAVGKDELRAESFAELDRLIQVLRDNPKLKIEIQGHTSLEPGIKKDKINLELSNRRAKAVSAYIISKGIQVSRLRVKGYGSSKPAYANDSEQTRIKNRRVSFIALKN